MKRRREKNMKLAIVLLAVEEYFVPERSKVVLSVTASVSRVSDNAIFLGFPWISCVRETKRERKKNRDRIQGTKRKQQDVEKQRTRGWHVERRQQRGARFTRCPQGTHWFQMFPTSHLYLLPSHNRANIENAFWAKNISHDTRISYVKFDKPIERSEPS